MKTLKLRPLTFPGDVLDGGLDKRTVKRKAVNML